MEKTTWTVKEFMEITGSSRSFTYKLINNGQIVTIRLGRKLLIPGWFVRKLMEEPK
jgi:excisionase family DNA binding protein